MTSVNNKVTTFLEGFGKLVILSILWILCCLPVITLIPSAAALYYTVVKCVRRDTGNLLREYFYCFKENMRQGIVIDLIVLPLAYVYWFISEFIHYVGPGSLLGHIYITFLIVSISMTILILFYLLPVITRFKVTLLDGVRIALVLAFQNLPTLIPLFITGVCLMVLIYLIPGTVFFIPGSFAYLMSFSVEKALKKFLVSNADDPKQYEHMWFMDQDEKENIHFKDYFRSGNRK